MSKPVDFQEHLAEFKAQGQTIFESVYDGVKLLGEIERWYIDT